MTARLILAIAISLLAGLTGRANAASISIVYVGTNEVDPGGKVLADTGDLLVFDMVMDFTDHPTIGGGFDILFDTSALGFVSLIEAQPCMDFACPDQDPTDGRLQTGFASFTPLTGPALVASVTFQVTGDNVQSTFVALGPTTGIRGPFISGVDFMTIIDVDYNAIEIGAVPVPAAAWFLLSGLLALLGVGATPTRPA